MSRIIKRVCAWAMVLVLSLSMLPIQAFAASNRMKVRVQSTDGTLVTGATLTAKAVNNYNASLNYSLTYEERGNGEYYVYRNNYSSGYTITITVNANGYEEQTVSVRGMTTSTSITLEPVQNVEQWQEFEMFYYLNGNEDAPFPNSYAGAGAIGNYGPSQDNIPFAVLNVNIAALRTNYPEYVVYGENTFEGNKYQFTPKNTQPQMEAVKSFWQAVLECADEESKARLEETGLADLFIGYAAKFDGGTYHIDGILVVPPPVFSIELYKDERANGGTYSYVGGLVSDKDNLKTIDEVLTTLEGYLGYTITWHQDASGKPVAENGVYSGTFIENKHLHTITVYQSNADRAEPVENSEIPYEKKSEYYYVAYYILKIEAGQQVEFTVTYTDGDAAGTAFADHSYGVTKTGNTDPAVPAFTGLTVREGYTFLGWVLEGGDGKLLSNEEVQQMSVTQNMVFHAQWEKLFTVVFHTNNTSAESPDIFRIYRSNSSQVQDGEFLLNNGVVDVFYDIPTFEYNVHNGYIFKGWYMGTEEDAAPMDWNAAYEKETHIYAHWIYVGTVAKEEDGKQYESTVYPEFDLLGNQIRTATQDDLPHYGNAAPGLRFVASLSERIFEEMNGIHTENNSGIEYGFVLVRADRASDMLKYKDAFLNGEDTTQSHKYVQNVVCRDAGDGEIVDHYDGEAYRLYTAVITYQDLDSISLEDAQRVEFIGRAYLRYFDANGLERVHYNNYTGNSNTYGGVKTSYTDVYNLLNGQ